MTDQQRAEWHRKNDPKAAKSEKSNSLINTYQRAVDY